MIINRDPVNLPLTIINPDTAPIQQRSRIDISLSNFDISASSYIEAVKLNYNETEVVVMDSLDPDSVVTGSLYYTPLYTEKINYNQWVTEINKSFRELENI